MHSDNCALTFPGPETLLLSLHISFILIPVFRFKQLQTNGLYHTEGLLVHFALKHSRSLQIKTGLGWWRNKEKSWKGCSRSFIPQPGLILRIAPTQGQDLELGLVEVRATSCITSVELGGSQQPQIQDPEN